MSVSGMKREIPTIESEARAICKLTAGNHAQYKLAVKLTEDILELNEAIKQFEHGMQPETTAQIIGEEMQKIANATTALSGAKTPLYVHKRLNVIFGILKTIKAEGLSKENPLVIKWIEIGMKKAANAV